MTTASVTNTSVKQTVLPQQPSRFTSCQKMGMAISVITIIGSLAAAGYFYSCQNMNLAWIVGGAGSALGVGSFAVSCCAKCCSSVRTYSLDQIYQSASHFKKKDWQNLSLEQRKAIDFSKLPEGLRKEAFLEMFDCSTKEGFNAFCSLSSRQREALKSYWLMLHGIINRDILESQISIEGMPLGEPPTFPYKVRI